MSPTPYQQRLNPYIQRMVEDMQVRNLSPKTIDAYTYHVDKFCCHFGKPAEQLGPDEIHQYQVYLVNQKKVSWSSFNQAVCGLRFLYEITLGKPWAVRHIPFGKRSKKLPTVLSDQEASRLLACVENPKHQAVLLTCYAAGLRLAEATHLRVADTTTEKLGATSYPAPPPPRVIDLLRKYTPKCMSWHRVSQQVKSVLSRILLCRTSVLRGHLYECPQCGSHGNMYNSCTDRHCPQCVGARRADWLAKTQQLLLPGVNYFQVVFTLPDRFSPLILGR
jgi:integrase